MGAALMVTPRWRRRARAPWCPRRGRRRLRELAQTQYGLAQALLRAQKHLNETVKVLKTVVHTLKDYGERIHNLERAMAGADEEACTRRTEETP